MNSNSSRDEILNRLRAINHTDVAHPEVKRYSWPGVAIENFKKKLSAFDGKYMEFASREEAVKWLRDNIDVIKKNVYSAVADFDGNIDNTQVSDPHKAHIVDICVAEGCFGVGETGSVWVTDASLGEPACALFSTDLYLFLPKSKVLPSLQEAYDKIQLGTTSYGSYFTGPSATADIEAVHITGAQGEISLTVLLY